MLRDFSTEARLKMLNIINERKQLITQIGGCPTETERVNPECFHCDDCWIRAIEKSLKK